MAPPDLHVVEGDKPLRVSLYTLARQFLDDHDGSVHDATDALVDYLRDHPHVLSLIVHEAVCEAVKVAVAHQHRQARADIIRSVNKPFDIKAAVTLGRSVHVEMLLNYPLAGGLQLKDATRLDVQENAARYLRSAKAHRERGAWLELIAAQLPDDTCRVADVLTERDVQAFFNEVRHA
jgi:hypothetical protein